MNKGVFSGKMRRNLHFSLFFIYLFDVSNTATVTIFWIAKKATSEKLKPCVVITFLTLDYLYNQQLVFMLNYKVYFK